jgi:hypothetical protein
VLAGFLALHVLELAVRGGQLSSHLPAISLVDAGR